MATAHFVTAPQVCRVTCAQTLSAPAGVSPPIALLRSPEMTQVTRLSHRRARRPTQSRFIDYPLFIICLCYAPFFIFIFTVSPCIYEHQHIFHASCVHGVLILASLNKLLVPFLYLQFNAREDGIETATLQREIQPAEENPLVLLQLLLPERWSTNTL